MATAKKIPSVNRPARTPARASARTAVKTAPAASTKPVHKPSLPPAATASLAIKPAQDKSAKARKPKLVRDSFTIPKAEYLVLDELKQRAGRLSSPAKKSELLRAGIKALAAMPDTALLVALQAVPAIKTGRPSKA